MAVSVPTLYSGRDPPCKKRKLNNPLVVDALSPISRVLQSGDHFEVLQLVAPSFDELDRVVWTVQKATIKKQYFSISRQVHPDRHVHDASQATRAAQSFDTVQRAFETLHDNVRREEYVNQYAEKLKYKRSKAKFEMQPTEDNVATQHDNSGKPLSLEKQVKSLEDSRRKRRKKRALIEQEADEYARSILEDFHQKQQRVKMKLIRGKQTKKALASLNVTELSKEETDSENEDSDAEYEKTLSNLKRKQRSSRRRTR